LHFLLDELRIDEQAIVGSAADNCMLFTASDGYVRNSAEVSAYKLSGPTSRVFSHSDPASSFRGRTTSCATACMDLRVGRPI